MKVLIDQRQKEGKHDLKHAQIVEQGYDTQVVLLDFGDYMFDGIDTVSVDTKYSVQELYQDLISDHGRFRREVIRAYEQKAKLYILIEDDNATCLSDIKRWSSTRSKANGSVVFKKAKELQYAYGVEYVFCKPKETGYKIINLLKRGCNLQDGVL